jgi:hypothetical protein
MPSGNIAMTQCRGASGWHRMAEGSRRFPALWRVGKITGGYLVRDANGQALAYLYSRDNEVEVRQARMLTKDEGSGFCLPDCSLRSGPFPDQGETTW